MFENLGGLEAGVEGGGLGVWIRTGCLPRFGVRRLCGDAPTGSIQQLKTGPDVIGLVLKH